MGLLLLTNIILSGSNWSRELVERDNKGGKLETSSRVEKIRGPSEKIAHAQNFTLSISILNWPTFNKNSKNMRRMWGQPREVERSQGIHLSRFLVTHWISGQCPWTNIKQQLLKRSPEEENLGVKIVFQQRGVFQYKGRCPKGYVCIKGWYLFVFVVGKPTGGERGPTR